MPFDVLVEETGMHFGHGPEINLHNMYLGGLRVICDQKDWPLLNPMQLGLNLNLHRLHVSSRCK